MYRHVEIGVIEAYGCHPFPYLEEGLCGVSILNFSVLENLLRVLRSKIGLHSSNC